MPNLGLFRNAKKFLFGGTPTRVRLYVLGIAKARDAGHTRTASLLEARLQNSHGVFLSHKAQFPTSLDLKHPVGIVIGEGVHIGANVTIYQNVTLGGARSGDGEAGRYPTIGDGTTIFAGAVVVGGITVGSDCVIGANAVVIHDVPDNSTAIGVPARIVPRSSKNKEKEAAQNEHS